VQRLCKAGHSVRVLTLPNDAKVENVKKFGAEIFYGDISNENDVKNACEKVDAVYHLAAIIVTDNDLLYKKINVNGTRNIVESAKQNGVEHLIHVSSASVTYPRPTPYSSSKRECEKIVSNSGLGFTIIRPTLVYDKQGGLEFNMFLSYLNRFHVVPFIGKGKAVKRPVFSEDIIMGLQNLYKNKIAVGKIYNFSGPDRISMIDLSRLCLCLMGKGGRKIVHIPVSVCKMISCVMAHTTKNPPLKWPVIAGVIQDADLDPSEAIKEVGYNPARLYEKLPGCFPRRL
jgi:NADH dehydrogenase